MDDQNADIVGVVLDKKDAMGGRGGRQKKCDRGA